MAQRFKHWVKPQIIHGKPTKYGWVVYYPKGLKLGDYTDIGWGCFLQARWGIRIEDYAQLGAYTCLYSENSENKTNGPIIIKKNAKIGAHCVILPNVCVGENSFVGAGTIVTKDVPDNHYYANVRVTRLEPL